MQNQPVAVIDMGTNTFHLLIAAAENSHFRTLHKESRVMKIGQGGISQGYLTEAAYRRTIDALTHFRLRIDEHGVSIGRVFATATSAIRSARNGPQLVEEIARTTGIRVEVIEGSKEAEYIYYGVRNALPLGREYSLIMDIGGGSVEFIIGNEDTICWKQSFEIGAQRLFDQFMTSDPIPAQSMEAMDRYLEQKLAPLTRAVAQYQPRQLVGSSGSFDTLVEIYYLRSGQEYDEEKNSEFLLPVPVFFALHRELTTADRQTRLAIPGMLEMRADMIVLASCLIHFVLRNYDLQQTGQVRVSSYALKEGVLWHVLNQS